MPETRGTLFTGGPIAGLLIQFALPMLTASFLQSMYGAVDLMVVRRFAGTADVSAVSTGSQVMMTVTGIFMGLATPASSLVQVLLCVLYFLNIRHKRTFDLKHS